MLRETIQYCQRIFNVVTRKQSGLQFWLIINSLSPWWQFMTSQTLVDMGSGDGLVPDGTKPLPEPMLTSHQQSPLELTWAQFTFIWSASRMCGSAMPMNCEIGQWWFPAYWFDVGFVPVLSPSMTACVNKSCVQLPLLHACVNTYKTTIWASGFHQNFIWYCIWISQENAFSSHIGQVDNSGYIKPWCEWVSGGLFSPVLSLIFTVTLWCLCCNITGLILGLHPANERQLYIVMTSLIGWAKA